MAKETREGLIRMAVLSLLLSHARVHFSSALPGLSTASRLHDESRYCG